MPFDRRTAVSTGTMTEAVEQVKWYVKRLSVMEPEEVLHRLREQCALTAMQVKYSLVGRAPRMSRYEHGRCSFCASIGRQLPDLSWSFDPDDKTVTTLLNGTGSALGCRWSWTRNTAAWHKAPDTGQQWPRTFFASIPHRTGNPFGDVRIAWEPSRLQHLVLLGLLADRRGGTRGDEAAILLKDQLCSWTEANPPLHGIHYLSAMECALRILAVCHATDLARETLIRLGQAEPVWRSLLGLVESHAAFIARRLSRHSSLGNHTVAEGAGLLYAGVLFPELEDAALWSETGLSLLEQEADHQIAADGGGVEQSFRYLQFIVDLYGLVIALLTHRRRAVPRAILKAHDRGRLFLQAFAAHPEELPAIGDSDNGYALSPALRLLCGSGGAAPLPPATAAPAQHLPDAAPDVPAASAGSNGHIDSRFSDVRTFHDSGYTLVRDEARQVGVIVDHGPLGMAPSYGHGHADALSVIVRRGREAVLIDPGTGTYTGDARWRAYFRGTRAHNTVTVDGLDQAAQETPFIWSHPYTVTVVRREASPDGGFRLLARHDGYGRLRPGVDHWRAIVHRPPGQWLIWDRLDGQGRHTLDLHWHCGLEPLTGLGVIVFPGRPEAMAMAVGGGVVTLHRAELDPVCGWRSRIYGVMEPITTIRARYAGALPHEFATQLWTGTRRPDAWETELPLLREWVREGAYAAAQG